MWRSLLKLFMYTAPVLNIHILADLLRGTKNVNNIKRQDCEIFYTSEKTSKLAVLMNMGLSSFSYTKS